MSDEIGLAARTAQKSDNARYAAVLGRIFTECKRVLRPKGRLFITYANRDPGAWIALVEAVTRAGFRLRGYEIVQSDAEVDVLKKKGHACTMDIVLDFAPASKEPAPPAHRPRKAVRRCEWAFLSATGEALRLAVSDNPPVDWKDRLKAAQSRSWTP